MPCYSPLSAWQTDGGDVVFVERGSIRRSLELPCGQCVGCRLERSRQWAMRCMHESQCHEFSSFVTLTYDEDNCPRSLRYRDFQLFMKRLRKVFPRTRFYMCGEYGENFGRPHYHAILFGVFFYDRVLHSESAGYRLYRSDLLSRLWPLGFASVGDVSFESAAYVARYIMKKVNGGAAEEYYKRVDLRSGEMYEVVPEFARMSLRPGIGATWFERYCSDVFGAEKDSVVINGVQCKAPRFYLERLKKKEGDLAEHVEYLRAVKAGKGLEDRTPERLAVRENVIKARMRFFKRGLQ